MNEQTSEIIAEDFAYPSHFIDVDGAKIHYIEQGIGDPILLLHGVPTSCYLWRNVIPYISRLGRCIAPDLIGFGRSGKPDIEYNINDHIHYIEGFINALNLKKIVLVMHGWGSVIGLDYAMRFEKNCRSLIFYESYLHPLTTETISLPYQEQMEYWMDKLNNLDLLTSGTDFVDEVLTQSTMRKLSQQELSHYRQPFSKPGSGKPIYQYLLEVPLGNKHDHVTQLINDNSQKLMNSSLPKLLLYAMPGFITTVASIMWAKEHLSHLELFDIGEALDHVQETNPRMMGEAISIWLQGLEQHHK